MSQLNTRIILRNDSTTAWLENESVVLLRGEVGIEFLTNGKVKMKIGDGTSTWAQLNYFGGEDAHVYDVVVAKGADHVVAISAKLGETVPNTHDVAIVKEAMYDEDDLAEGEEQDYQFTAYRYNGTAWAAMDGNYSAENVYFTKDFTFTEKIGTVQTLTNGSATKEAAGKNMQEFFASLFASESNPTTDQPTISLSASGGSGEVGTQYTLPTATLKIDDVGSYTYGPATGVKFATGNAKITQGENSISNTTDMVASNTIKLQATDTERYYLDTAKSYTFEAEATHTDGAVPVTNLGNDYEDGQIKSTKLTKEATATFTGYRCYFYGALKVKPSETTLTSADIRDNLTNGGNYNAAKSFTIKANGAADLKAFIVAIPNSNTRSGITEVKSTAGMTVDMTESYVLSDKKVSVADARGTVEGVDINPVDYKFYVWEPASIDSGAVHEFKLG